MKRRSPQAWRSLIEEWQASDLTQKEFCTQQSIAYSGFHYWSKKFREEKSLPPYSSGFIPVNVTPSASKALIELVMPDGRRVHFHEGVDVGFLRALLS
jgi:hypothetical protein